MSQRKTKPAPSKDSDQPGHPPRLTRVFAVRSMGSLRRKHSSLRQRRLWSDWADAKADLNSLGAHAILLVLLFASSLLFLRLDVAAVDKMILMQLLAEFMSCEPYIVQLQLSLHAYLKCAGAQHSYKITCAPSEDSGLPAISVRMIGVFCFSLKDALDP